MSWSLEVCGWRFEGERPVAQIAADLGVHREALRERVRQAEADSSKRPELLANEERDEIRRFAQEEP